MLKKLTIIMAVAAASALTSHAASIAWGAAQDNGFSQNNAAELAIGNLVRLGSFSLSDGQITTFFNAGDIASLNSNFVEVTTARIGDVFNTDSNYSGSANTDTTAVTGLQMYYWVLASTNNASITASKNTAFEMGIFYMDKTVQPAWAFPAQSPVPGSTIVDISDLTNNTGTSLVAGAHIVVGSFPKGASTAGGAPNFGLTPVVPEPTSAALLMVGLVSLAARRRRQAN